MDSIENNNLNEFELVKSKHELIELKSKLKQYKLISGTVNVALLASLLGFAYTHFTAREKDIISGGLFILFLFSKLYFDNKTDIKEEEYKKAEIRVRTLEK